MGLEGAWSGDFEGVGSAGFKEGVWSGVKGTSSGFFSSRQGTFGLRGTEGWWPRLSSSEDWGEIPLEGEWYSSTLL